MTRSDDDFVILRILSSNTFQSYVEVPDHQTVSSSHTEAFSADTMPAFMKLPVELQTQIALNLDGRDLFTLLQVNQQLWSLRLVRTLWAKKLNISRTQKIPVETLRRRYVRKCRAVDAIEGKRVPISVEHPIDTEVGEIARICNIECGPALFFRLLDEGTTITDFRSDLSFKKKPYFFPCELFDCGNLCLGYENSSKTVRRVQDWSLVAQFETDPNDTFFIGQEPERIWTTAGPESDLLLSIHLKGDLAGKIEVCDSVAGTCKGTIWHPDISTWANIPGSKLLTVDKNSNSRIWDLRHLTYDTLPIDLGPGPVSVTCQGNILEFATHSAEESETIYYHVRNGLLPHRLQTPYFLLTFSDGTYVLGERLRDGNGSIGEKYQFQFSIYTSCGIEQGRFHDSDTKEIITFMDHYIVTVAYRGDLIIWNKLGAQLFTTYLGWSNPVLVEAEVGSLVALNSLESIVLSEKTLDFTKSQL